MADTTISLLPTGTPSSSASIPFSDSGSTKKSTPDKILTNATKVGIGEPTPSSKLTVSGSIYSSGQGRFAGWYTGGDGAGLATEIGTSGGQGYLYAFNRTASTYAPINIATGNAGLQINTNGVINATGTLNLAGPYKGTIQRGSYGSLTIGGSNNGYSGIDFTDSGSTFMIRNSDSLAGVYKNNNTWAWYFDGAGNLVSGTVPWSNVSGRPDSQQLAKAWLRFNGPGTSVPANGANVTSLITASYNISSLTFVSQNRWRAFFTTPFANANHLCGAGSSSANNLAYNLIAGVSFTTTYVEFYTPNGGNVNTSSTLLPTGTTSFIVYSL